MATNTSRLGLLKKDTATDGNDTFNIKTMLNDNWDKIDAKVATLGADGKVPADQLSISVSDASTTQKGVVQLEDSVASTSITKAATPKSVKTVNDALASHKADDTAHGIGDKKTLLTTNKTSIVSAINEVFQNGNSRKIDVVNALLSVDNSLPITTESSWADIVANIPKTSTGGFNVFTQETAPSSKNGIWFETNAPKGSITTKNMDNEYFSKTFPTDSITLPAANWTEFAVTSLGDCFYLIGGYINRALTSNVYKYNCKTQTWTKLSDLPSAIRLTTAISDNSRYIYTLGGFGSNGYGTSYFFRYDVTTNTWTTLSGLPSQRKMVGAVFTPSYIYCYGGEPYSTGNTTSTIYKYTISDNTWTTLSVSMPKALNRTSVVNYGKYNYIFGGMYSIDGTSGSSSTIYKHDTSTDIITTVPGSISSYNAQSANLFKGKIYLFTYTSSFGLYILDLKNESVSSQNLTPINIDASIRVGYKIYNLSGSNNNITVYDLSPKITGNFGDIWILQNNGVNDISVNLYSAKNLSGSIATQLTDVALCGSDGKWLDCNVYYGNGSSWIPIK